ncbi:MAG: hypothetical protein QM652_04950 [Legionella sp.]|uniref:hypothetical protein n=1 Tax=Legionella sp. TaxID=459 RepID=UPI0039E4C5A7
MSRNILSSIGKPIGDSFKRKRNSNSLVEDIDTDSTDTGSTGTGDFSGRKRKSDFLVEETRSMARKRRLIEQDGQRRIARVEAKEHSDDAEVTGNYQEEAFNNGIKQHPNLNTPLHDGRDPTVSVLPNVGDVNRTKFENERREQEQEKQYRLGYMPGNKNNLRPQGPR